MLGFSNALEFKFYGGSGATSDIQAFHCALNGRPYMLDTKASTFTQGSEAIPLIRQQADGSDEPGETTINPEDLWPRTQQTFYLGAGQEFFDQRDSVRQRFFKSQGVDPWTRGQLSLLNDTTQRLTDANLTQQVFRVGAYTYYVTGQTMRWTLDGVTWTTVDLFTGTNQSPQTVKGACSDGYTVYTAVGSAGIHASIRGETTSTHLSSLSATLIDYVKGRLMAANGQALYNVTGGDGTYTTVFTHPNTDWRWVAFGQGPVAIYAAGYSGDKSAIYRIGIKEDGTGLDVPAVAAELPDGEIVQSVAGYLGFVLVGTTQGLRVAQADGTGNLILGALIKTGSAVAAFEPQDRFVWFGWQNFDSTHTGLGRVDLSVNTADGVPAYASDLMAAGQGQVTSICTDAAGKRWFSVAGVGLYQESSTQLSTGWIDSGTVDFGIPDQKIALRANLRHKPLATGASVAIQVAADGGSLQTAGVSATPGTTGPAMTLKVPEVAGRAFNVRTTLNNGAVLEMWDFRAFPSARVGRTIMAPILLFENFRDLFEDDKSLDIVAEREYIQALVGTQRLVTYQELGSTYSVIVQEVNFLRDTSMNSARTAWNCVAVCKLKVMGD